MSSCLVLQDKGRVFIGADTSSSVFIGNELYRLGNNNKKLFVLNNNTICYCAGNNTIAEIVIRYIYNVYNTPYFSYENLEKWLAENFPNPSYKNERTIYDVEILIATIENNQSIVYQLSQYNHYKTKQWTVSVDGMINIFAAGIKNKENVEFAETSIKQKISVQDIYKNVFTQLSCNYIGGNIDLYCVTTNGIIRLLDNFPIKEKDIVYCGDIANAKNAVSINGEVLCGKMFLGEKLTLQNNSGNYKFDDNGFIASSGNNSVKIQPNNNGELFSIYKGSDKQFYINSDGDTEFSGILRAASGQFSGLVSGGSINIGNGTFLVDENGDMTANSGKFGGTLDGADGTFSGTLTGSEGIFGNVTLNSNGISSPYFNVNSSGASFDGKITAGTGSTIGGWTITNGKIYGGDASSGVAVMQRPSSSTTYVFAAGGTSHESYSNCPFRVTKNGSVYASKGRIGGFDISDNGFKRDDGTTIWENTIKTDYLYATSSSTALTIGSSNKKTYIEGSSVYVNDSEVATAATLTNYALKSHTHPSYTTTSEVKSIIKSMVKSSSLK